MERVRLMISNDMQSIFSNAFYSLSTKLHGLNNHHAHTHNIIYADFVFRYWIMIPLLEKFYLINMYSDPAKNAHTSAQCHKLCNMARAVAINRLGVALLDKFYLINLYSDPTKNIHVSLVS